MKKRKIKLFASVASLAMVAAVMGVGVWAASSQAVSVNSTVQFASTSIDATIKLHITGDNLTSADGREDYKTQQETLATFTKDETAKLKSDKITVVYGGDASGMAIAGDKITYTFNVAPTTPAETIHFNVVAPTVTEDEDTHYTYTVQVLDGATGDTVLTGNQTATGAEGKTFRVVYTLDLGEEVTTAADSFSVDLGNIRINLANNETNLTHAGSIVGA